MQNIHLKEMNHSFAVKLKPSDFVEKALLHNSTIKEHSNKNITATVRQGKMYTKYVYDPSDHDEVVSLFLKVCVNNVLDFLYNEGVYKDLFATQGLNLSPTVFVRYKQKHDDEYNTLMKIEHNGFNASVTVYGEEKKASESFFLYDCRVCQLSDVIGKLIVEAEVL